MSVRVIEPTPQNDWRAATVVALMASVKEIDAALVMLADLEELLGQELVLDEGSTNPMTIAHELRTLSSLLRCSRAERQRQADRLRAAADEPLGSRKA